MRLINGSHGLTHRRKASEAATKAQQEAAQATKEGEGFWQRVKETVAGVTGGAHETATHVGQQVRVLGF